MRQHLEEFRRLKCEVVAVGFEPLSRLQEFARAEGLDFPVLSDPELNAYRAFGFQKGWTYRVFGPGTLWAYAKGLFGGHWPRVPRADVLQLGGDVVIDASGKVVLLSRSRDPADRPAVDTLLEAIRQSTQRNQESNLKPIRHKED